MEGGNSALREKVAKLIREAAEAKVALDRAEGKIKGIPHYSVIEDAAHELGREVSRLVQQIHMTDLLARQSLSGKCPQCGGRQALRTQHRTVASGDGPVDLIELVGDCTCCRRAFFPSAGKPGI